MQDKPITKGCTVVRRLSTERNKKGIVRSIDKVKQTAHVEWEPQGANSHTINRFVKLKSIKAL